MLKFIMNDKAGMVESGISQGDHSSQYKSQFSMLEIVANNRG